MQDGTGLLDASVVAPPDDLAVEDQHRSDGDAALGQSSSGLRDRCLHELVFHGYLSDLICWRWQP